MQNLDDQMGNFNKVKDLVLRKLVEENLLSEDDADEFGHRCQILLYKNNWFRTWAKKIGLITMDDYHIRIIEMQKKESELDRLMRRTTGDYDE